MLYQQLLNLQTAAFSLICHDEAMVAIVYKVTKPSGKELILKISERPGDYLREVYFLKYLSLTSLPLPKIIQTVEPSEDLHGAILMECLPGALLKPSELTVSLAFDIGRSLALIHSHRLPGFGDPICALNADPRPYFKLKFKEGFEECAHHLPLDLRKQCRRYYEAYADLLLSSDGPCVVHRDFRPGNIIVHKGKLQGIIDWAGARVSFAEEDFCSIEHGEWQFLPNTKESFMNGYASIRPIPNYKRLISFLRLNKAIATIGFTVKKEIWKSSASSLYQTNRQFLESFFKENL